MYGYDDGWCDNRTYVERIYLWTSCTCDGSRAEIVANRVGGILWRRAREQVEVVDRKNSEEATFEGSSGLRY